MLDFFNGLCYNVIKLVAKVITLHFDILFFNTLIFGALDRVSYPTGCNNRISNPMARLTKDRTGKNVG